MCSFFLKFILDCGDPFCVASLDEILDSCKINDTRKIFLELADRRLILWNFDFFFSLYYSTQQFK